MMFVPAVSQRKEVLPIEKPVGNWILTVPSLGTELEKKNER